MKKPASLFEPPAGRDPLYQMLRDANHASMRAGKDVCDKLWDLFRDKAEAQFASGFTTDVVGRFWEMYLAVGLQIIGYDIQCAGAGPDIGIVHNGVRIWLEAVTLNNGEAGNPNTVRDFDGAGGVEYVSDGQVLLRYLSAIQGKMSEKYAKWLTAGTIQKEDCFVIAINSAKIVRDVVLSDPPSLLRVAYPVGTPYVAFDAADSESETILHYMTRFSVPKKGATDINIPTGLFLRDDCVPISALLGSGASPWQCTSFDFCKTLIVAPNPRATTPLPPDFQLPGRHFPATLSGDSSETVYVDLRGVTISYPTIFRN